MPGTSGSFGFCSMICNKVIDISELTTTLYLGWIGLICFQRNSCAFSTEWTILQYLGFHSEKDCRYTYSFSEAIVFAVFS